MRLLWTIVSGVALGLTLAGASTARPVLAAHGLAKRDDFDDDHDAITTALHYARRLDVYRSMAEQIAALSPEDLRTFESLRPQRGEEVTLDDKRFFSRCLWDEGVTTRTGLKHALPVAVYCKRKLAEKKERDDRQKQARDQKRASAAANRQQRAATRAARRTELAAARRKRRTRGNQFARATVALAHVGRVLDAGLRRVFDPNAAPAASAATAGASARGALPAPLSLQKLESVLPRGRLWAEP
ncbi:MAG: hypothetical protein M1826_002118 [Phylliscum demangeonii]|nr:MAG: hypothetical protein M1826_002118 [Phylliscum demangeonii]